MAKMSLAVGIYLLCFFLELTIEDQRAWKPKNHTTGYHDKHDKAKQYVVWKHGKVKHSRIHRLPFNLREESTQGKQADLKSKTDTNNLDEQTCGANQKSINKVECGRPSIRCRDQTRIVGGNEATPYSWPWAVNLEYNADGVGWMHYCGGTILSPCWIAIAAHCVFGKEDLSVFRVIIGEHNLKQTDANEKIFALAKIVVHQKFTGDTDDCDIALILLKTEITFNKFISPVCLPTPTTIKVGTVCCVVGWGETQGTGTSDVLREVYVPVIDSKVCNQETWYRSMVTSNMMCCGYAQGKMDACSGDSGGPLVCRSCDRYFLHGIISWGVLCANPYRPGVYTRVTKFVSWITTVTGVKPYAC